MDAGLCREDELRRALERHHGIEPAERKGVRQRRAHGCFAGRVRHAIEIALGIGVDEIRGGRDHAFAQGADRGDDFQRAGGAQRMTVHGFGG